MIACVPSRYLEKWQPPWLHVLREADREKGPGDDWTGRVKAIGREVDRSVGGLKDQMKEVMEAMQEQARTSKALLDRLDALERRMVVQSRGSAGQAAPEAGHIQGPQDQDSGGGVSESKGS
jgi:Sec-independent protein translocase protein TatA